MTAENWHLNYTYETAQRITRPQGTQILILLAEAGPPGVRPGRKDTANLASLLFRRNGEIKEIVPAYRQVTSDILTRAGVEIVGFVEVQAKIVDGEPEWQDVSYLLDSPETPAP